jgi:hypothetical protein
MGKANETVISKDQRELFVSEMKERHQYVRDLFKFETTWNGAVWTLNALTFGWLLLDLFEYEIQARFHR